MLLQLKQLFILYSRSLSSLFKSHVLYCYWKLNWQTFYDVVCCKHNYV